MADNNQAPNTPLPSNKIHEELWHFPCEHSVKVMGYSQFQLIDIICEILKDQSILYYEDSIRVKESRKGKYQSVTIKMAFTRKEEVEGLYASLAEREEIVWAL